MPYCRTSQRKTPYKGRTATLGSLFMIREPLPISCKPGEGMF
ncbi:hypothetical protein HM1_0288 [Heliomicrobium modesticaldum Ice1]|uniref:Uncharacterized protein n=1 Tax=Heliobacterium modesticaldum (strain ATCC 51547 / Ice1) TaxID=498761 RepID=B0TEI8_HELMI|nr:hypothetical protein HM1_0288 [Heliomicrobium modesticaldum Ice1]